MDGQMDWLEAGWVDGWMDECMITNKNTDISPSISTNGSSKPRYGLTGSRATK